jgi:hypothetical protein
VIAPVRVLKLATPELVDPFTAEVILPYASTVIFALVYDPAITEVVAKSISIDPDEVTGLPVAIIRLGLAMTLTDVTVPPDPLLNGVSTPLESNE